MTHLIRGHKTQPSSSSPQSPSHTITPDTITTTPAPHCHTVRCAVLSHTVSYRPRCCLSCCHGHRTPRPSPRAPLHSVPLSSMFPARSFLPSTHQLPLPLQLRSAHRTSLLTPPPFTPWCWGEGVQPRDSKKLLCKAGPVAMVPIRWGGARAQTSRASLLPLKPRGPHTEPGKPAQPSQFRGSGQGQNVGYR